MIRLAKTAGFCFGVKNALQIIETLLNNNEKVCTLGNIINNPLVVSDLKARGVVVLTDVLNAKKDYVLVIRSHGVDLKTYENVKKLNLKFKDATCPFVRRIQQKVLEQSKLEKTILIAGDKTHPEVVGIVGHCKKKPYVFSSLVELEKLILKHSYLKNCHIFAVAQTTFNIKIWNICVDFLRSCCSKLEIFSSICSATIERQNEAQVYSKKSDLAVVIGGKNSSNTKKLYEICCKNCKTFFVEDISDLEKICYDFRKKSIFITAGASTPNYLICKILDLVVDMAK